MTRCLKKFVLNFLKDSVIKEHPLCEAFPFHPNVSQLRSEPFKFIDELSVSPSIINEQYKLVIASASLQIIILLITSFLIMFSDFRILGHPIKDC